MTHRLTNAPALKCAFGDAQIEFCALEDLKPYSNNPRKHSPKQIAQITQNMATFGWTVPILADNDSVVVAGHARLEAARESGFNEVPVIRLSNLTPEQARAYRLTDNRLAETAEWDSELLKMEIEALAEAEFEIEDLGFETGEIDIVLGADQPAQEPPVPGPSGGPAVSQIGDLYILGKHRLYCGDALNGASYDALLAREKADAVFTDPPYNVPVNGHVCGKGAVAHGEFPMASGEMSDDAYTAFLGGLCGHLAAHSADGSVHYICMDWRHIRLLLNSSAAHYPALLNICVWNKNNGGMGSLYRSKHELIAVFKNGDAAYTNNVALGRFGRNRTNVWDYPGVNGFSKDRDAALAMHPTVKPVALVADALLDVTNRGGLVLDPFSGSGTTIMAGEQTGRRVAAMELDPKYVDVAIRRFEAATGEAAVLAETGETFADVAARRGVASDDGGA